MKKFIKKVIPIFILLIIYIYILVIDSIPNNLTVFQGENLNIRTALGIKIKGKSNQEETDPTIEVSSNSGNSITNQVGVTKLNVNLLDKVFVKQINVDVLPRTKIIPVGSVAGVKLYTNGVLVVGMSEIEGEDQKVYKPYEQTGIKEGDTIVSINNIEISSTEELITEVNKSNGQDINVQYMHGKETLECSIKPIKTSKTEYKLGLWVRDSAAGVGTVTFYDQNTKGFAALGHGILDIDTEQLINISSGEFVTTKILKIDKGEKGNPRKDSRNIG